VDEYDWGVVTVWEPPGARLPVASGQGRSRRHRRGDPLHRLGAGRYPVEILHAGWERLGSSATPGGAQRDRWTDAAAAFRGRTRGRRGLMAEGTGSKRPVGADHARQAARRIRCTETRRPTHRPWCAGSARPPSRTTSGRSTTSTRGSSSRVTGCRSGVRREEGGRRGHRRGVGPYPRTIRSKVGTACARLPRALRHVLPPLLEALGLAEVTHDPRNNAMPRHLRALRPSPATIKEGDQCQPPEWSATGPSPSTPTRMSA